MTGGPNRLRQAASGLMLLSGVTHVAHFLFFDPSPSNTPLGAAFGVGFFAIGLLLWRSGALGLWLGVRLVAE